MKPTITLLATALLCLAHTAHAAEPVRAFRGARTRVAAKHLIPVMKGSEGYGQKYTFEADFGKDDGLYFSILITNLGIGDHKLVAKGHITIDGQEFEWKKELDDDEWSYEKKKLFIQAGPASIRGTPEALVVAAARGNSSFELTFTPIAQPWRPGNGRIQFGRKRYVTDYTVFPLMKVTGHGQINGGAKKEISGTGFGSHSWSELGVHKQALWMIEFRGISGEDTLYIRELKTTPEYGGQRVAYLLITRGREVLIESFNDDYKFMVDEKDVMTDQEHPNRYRVPESFKLLGRDASLTERQFRGWGKKKRLRKRNDLLKSMSSVARLVVERFSKPVRYEYETDFMIEVKTKEGVQRVGGLGRYELTHFNK